MPRLARLDAPGVLHHIIMRGIERRAIFRDDLDRENFLGRPSIIIPQMQSICYGWAFMSKRLGMMQPAVGYAVSRGEQIAKERNCNLVL